jgi:hypothetical protein
MMLSEHDTQWMRAGVVGCHAVNKFAESWENPGDPHLPFAIHSSQSPSMCN